MAMAMACTKVGAVKHTRGLWGGEPSKISYQVIAPFP